MTEQEISMGKTSMAKNWYILHTYSGFEKKVAETLNSRIDAEGLTELFGEIMVPTEDVIEMRQGRKWSLPSSFIRVMCWWRWK